VYSKEIENFLINNSLFEMHNLLNGNEIIKRDNTCIISSKCIDFAVITSRVINFIEGCELINYNQIIESDHRGYLIDINLEQYFKINQFNVNKISSSQLNSRRLTHKEIFCKKVKEYIQVTNLQQIMDDYCNKNASDKILELLD